MKLAIPFFLVILMLSSATCNDQPADSSKTQKMNILNTVWHLESMTIAGKKSAIFDATLQITADKISGHGSCNRFFGSYQMDKDRIIISKVGSTRMYCRKSSQFETSYLKSLEKVTQYKFEGEKMVLTFPKGKLVFSQKGQEPTEMAIIQNINWRLKTFTKGDTKRRVDFDITLRMAKDKISGNGGCNNYFGQYQQKSSQLTFSGIGATEMYCDKTSDFEMEYFSALEKVTAYSLADGELVLTFPLDKHRENGQLIFQQ